MALGYLARYTIPRTSGLAADDCINTFAYFYTGVGTPDNTAFAGLRGAIVDFYDQLNPPSTGDSPSQYLSTVLVRDTSHRFDVFEIPDTPGPLGSPVYSSNAGPFVQTVAGSDNLPSEVSVCLSFNASLVGVLEESGTTRPRARRRGRIYLGPLRDVVTEVNNEPHPPPALLNCLRENAADYLAAGAFAHDFNWGVWSREDWAIREVAAVSTDDAFDTQRRRGNAPTARTTLALT